MVKNFTMADILLILFNKIWILVAVMVAVGATSFTCLKLTEVELYSSTVSFIVNNATVLDGSSQYTSIINYVPGMAEQMVKTYTTILSSKTVRKKVLQTAELNYGTADLGKMILIESPEKTEVLTITITAPKASDAQRLANVYGEVAPGEIQRLATTGSCKLLDSASLATKPLPSNTIRNSLIITIISVVILGSIFVLLELFDNTINSHSDIRDNFDIPIIGTIPNMSEKK